MMIWLKNYDNRIRLLTVDVSADLLFMQIMLSFVKY